MARTPAFPFARRRLRAGDTGPQGLVGNTGPQGPKGDDGLPDITSSSSSPGRSLNTTFQPHATRPTSVHYAVSISCTVSLGGSQTGTVELRSDAADPPTTVRARASLTHSLGVGIGVGSTVATTDELSYLVPPAHYVRLVSSGSATIGLVDQTEVVM
jgi:hypothetical protein